MPRVSLTNRERLYTKELMEGQEIKRRDEQTLIFLFLKTKYLKKKLI